MSQNLNLLLRTHIRTYAHTYVRTHIHTYAHTYVHTYTRMHIRTYTHTYVCTYVRTHIRTYIRMHICTYVHKCDALVFYSLMVNSQGRVQWLVGPQFACPAAKEHQGHIRTYVRTSLHDSSQLIRDS